jgi:DNA-binding transcriptional MerR regulator
MQANYVTLGNPIDLWDESEGYRSPVVCSVAGVSYRQLDYWTREQIVVPSIDPGSGSGTQRRYDFEDLVELRLVRELLTDGRSLRACRTALDVYRETRDARQSGLHLFLISDPVTGWECVGDTEIDVERLTVVTIVSIDWVRVEVEKDLLSVELAARAHRVALTTV